MTDSAQQGRQELARFVRAMRDRLLPQQVGLAASPRRRAKGLLREEVAQRAGISATWYTWIEQARPTNPSLPVLARLARALNLSAVERSHLINLARPDVGASRLRSGAELPAPLVATLHGLMPFPVYVVDTCWNVIAWNAAAAELFGDFAAIEPPERNILRLLFLDSRWRSLFVDWDTVVESAVAQYRGATAMQVNDPAWQAHIATLAARSPEFARLWERQNVRDGAVWRKTIKHPEAGRLVFDYATLRPDSSYGDIQFVIYTPAVADSTETTADRACRYKPPGRHYYSLFSNITLTELVMSECFLFALASS